MLTTGSDNPTLSSGNDTITAEHTTFGASDVINGLGGIDTLNYIDSGTVGGALAAALVSNVEIINVRNVNGTAATAAVAETQTITLGGVITAGADTAFLGVNTTVLATDTLGDVAAKIVANKVAILAGAAAITAGITDITNGAAGEVVVKFGTTGDVAALGASVTSNGTTFSVGVEKVKGVLAGNSNGVTDTIAAGNFVGATDFNSNLSTNAVTVSGLATGQKVGVIGNGSVATNALSFAYATPTDAVIVNVAGGTKVGSTITNTGAGATAVTINSTGAANTVGAIRLADAATVKTLTVNAATNLTTGAITTLATDAAVMVSGAATSVTLGTTALTAAKTIDASGLTAGGVTVTLDTVVTSFKGGQGNDVVTTAASTTATALIDAGAGTADVLVLAAPNDITTAAKGAQYTNFETLRLNASQDVSLVSGITALQLNGQTSGVFTNISAAQAAAITVRGAQATALTLTLKDASGAADVVGLTLSNSSATTAVPAAVAVAGLSIIGVETLNVVAAGGVTNLATTVDTITFSAGAGAVDKLTAINITGSSSLSLDATNIAKAVAIDASGLTGTAAFNVLGAVVKGSVITGTANADTFATGTGVIAGAAGDFVTYNAGAGNDVISTTVVALNNTVNTNASLKIDGGIGTDTVKFVDTGSVTLVDANFQNITNVEVISHVVAGAASSITTGGFFDTNFKAVGATITVGETATGGAAQLVNASTFTGNLTVNALNKAAGTIDVTTGTGNDKVVLTAIAGSTGAITVTTGAGNDSVDATLVENTHTTTITTGAGNDSIVGLNIVGTIVGGAGADTISFSATNATVQTLAVAAGDSLIGSFDVVTGFATNSDVLKFLAADGTTATNAVAATLTGWTVGTGIATKVGATVANFIAAVSTSGTAGAIVFASGTDTYVGYSDGLATTTGDSIVELVGVTGATSISATPGANVIVIV